MHISASHILDWVNTKSKEAQSNLPRLIRRLCFEPTTTLQLSFPAGDSTYVPGWDGILRREQGDTWTPKGTSFWEIGCDQDTTKKANGDYQKRLMQTSAEDRSASTFVFVTPRRWLQKSDWISTQRAKKEWDDVRAYDADDLEQWLEQKPIISLQFSEELGLIGDGVESLSRHWQLWSHQSSPAITSDAMFFDRIPTRDLLVEKVRKGLDQQSISHPLMIQADSAEEATAFVIAALMNISTLADQALVVTTPAGWRFVESNTQLKIVVATRVEVASTPSMRSGLMVIIPNAIGESSAPFHGEILNLERPNIYEFEKALISIGMEESDAKRFALSTGRSWTVFRRQKAINFAIRHPAWLDIPQSSSLSLLCLLGSWNAHKEADQHVVQRLAARPYAEIERDLKRLAQLDDAPVLSIGTVWKAKSPLELLNLFGDRITRDELDRFFQIAREMLTVPDPQLELPEEDRYAAAVYGKIHPYSGLLFESVCDSLVKLAVRGSEQPGLMALEIEARVAQFVHELLDNADARRWLSLSSHLPKLAEAAPTIFLAAVDKSLRLPEAPVSQLLIESSTAGMGGRCWHAGLLWALESLAWAPSQLARVALLLAQLTHIPINGNWGNTPGRSLFALFRSWLPKTAAGLQDRIKVLDLLIKKDPDAAFAVLDGLTSPGPQMASDAARPKWRDDDAGTGRGVTYAEMNEMHAAASARIFQMSAGNPSRIVTLLQNTSKKEPDEVSRVLSLMEPFTTAEANDDDREILRGALRNTIHWHRNYDDAPAHELDAWLLVVENFYERLAPADTIKRHCWLFNSHWVELPSREREDPIQVRQSELTNTRIAALTEIENTLGMAGIGMLIATCKEPGSVGSALAKMNCTETQWIEWFIEKGGDFMQGDAMTWCISGILRSAPSPRSTEWLQHGMKKAEQLSWDVPKCARFLNLARPERETWDLAAEFSDDVEMTYWTIAQPGLYQHEDDADFMYVLNRLLEAKRPRTALKCCQHELERVDAPKLYVMLKQFLAGEEPNGPRLDSWHLGKMLERLETSNAIEKMALIQLEFGLFPALGYGQEARACALYAGVMTEPALFTELICHVYKPEHGEREEPITDASRAAAETAWKILHACKHQPGTQKDGNIDHHAFTEFIDKARELCRQADRLTMCEQTLGQILAYAPADEDGTWPFLPARDALDHADSEEMRIGFDIGVHNKRGVTSRSPWDGGDQERHLAAHYRCQAEKVQYTHPNMAATLERIAKSYDHQGRREDVDANLRKESY